MTSWDQIVVLDNGSSTAKVGLASDPAPRVVAPNCTAHVKGQLKLLVADEVTTIRNASQLEFTRPFERGHVCNWGCELEVWRRLLIDAEGPRFQPNAHNADPVPDACSSACESATLTCGSAASASS